MFVISSKVCPGSAYVEIFATEMPYFYDFTAGVLCGVIGDNPASSPETGGRGMCDERKQLLAVLKCFLRGLADVVLCRDLCATTRGTLA